MPTESIKNSAGETVATYTDPRPLKIRLIEKFAAHVEAGGLEDLQQSRITLGHPAFRGMYGFDADANFIELEEVRKLLAWVEDPEHDRNVVNKRLAELEAERVQIEERIERERRALAANRDEFNRCETVRVRWTPIQDSLAGRYRRCPILHFLPEYGERLKAAGLRVPPCPNF